MADMNDYLAVVAIDFGTTYSGFAYAFNHQKYRAGQQGIHMNSTWGNCRGVSTLQTPTCILLNPDKSFHSFGYRAQAKYIELEEEQDRQYYYFDRFKMKLHQCEEIDSRTEITASNGKKVNALEVFAHAIRYLSEEATKLISSRSGKSFTKKDMLWVITVPAIWNHVSKQFMREASYEAGIISKNNPCQLVIALEPEAASLDCRERNMAEFVDKSDDNGKCGDVVSKPGTSYMVVDNGGGTVDITTHRINKAGSIDEIHRPMGGAWGGTLVENEFEDLLCQIFGSTVIKQFKSNSPAEWIEIMSDFEIKKRSPDFVSGDEMTRIRLPYSFPTDDKYVGRNPTKNNIMISKGCLCLGPDIMKSLFFPPLKKINDYLNRLLKERSLQDVKSIFLVGGFSENALLQNQIKRNFGSRYRILTPIDAGLSVMKGAVLFGLNRDSIKTRISPYTYGSDLSPIFNPKKHEEKYKFTLCGVERINVFNTLVTINENVKIGEVRTFIAYPTHDDQTSVHFGFYTTTQKQVKYVDEPHVKKVGCVTLPIPDITKGRNRKLELKVEFGRTEIKATTRDVKSGNVRTIYLDFMND